LTTSFAAADLIRHLRDEGFSGIVKTVTTALGKAFGMPKDISNYLCEIGVSNSYQTIRRRGQKDFAKKLLEGSSFRAERHDHLTNLFDNVGFFQGGNADRVGYLQSTLQVIAVTPVEDLVKLGIYGP
jgi:tryptophan 2,3-dioxygenase